MIRLLDPRLWKIVGGSLLLGFCVALAASAAFAFGIEGREIESPNSHSFSNIGLSFGSKWCYLRKGQIFDVEYDATIKRGDLKIMLDRRPWELRLQTVSVQKLSASSRGHFLVPITESGWYRLRTDWIPNRGYDIRYSISWSARWS